MLDLDVLRSLLRGHPHAHHYNATTTFDDIIVAVTGLPEPQEYHACIVAKFAFECLVKVNQVMKELEIQLGPDTGELGMRFGLHSGPVTAGVLKGERARFQLFGDTVNTGTKINLIELL